ncbi:MAG: DUF4340 domain-containing protein [Oscillospiraceae bacterium]|nr:DUF4340 domain-containing protein [Oscillospiraceae bacterium]
MSTKKIRILIIALLIAVAMSIAAYIAVDKMKTNEENQAREEALSLSLFSFDSNDINKVEIQNADGYFKIEPVDTSWGVTETDYQYDFELNAYYINSICSYMSDLTALKKLSVPAENLNNYGFADPVVLTCYDSTNTAYTLYIGDATATEEYYYAMLPDDATVYELDFNTADVLHGGMAYLKSPYMLKYYDVNISDVILEHDSEIIFDISNTSGAWEMRKPINNAQVNSANINSFLTSLSRLEIESFVSMVEDGSDLIKYHLDNPAYTLTVKTKDDEITTIDFAEFDKNDGSVYLVYEETGQIATMTINSVNFLQTQPSELLTDKVYSPSFTDVNQLEVQVDDLLFTMTMNHEENTYFLDDIQISEQNSDIQNLFRSLFQTVSNMTYDSLDLETDISDIKSDTEPTVIFKYTMLDNTEQEISLIPINDTYYQAFINGEYSHKIVRRRALSNNTGVLTYYEKITDALEEADNH